VSPGGNEKSGAAATRLGQNALDYGWRDVGVGRSAPPGSEPGERWLESMPFATGMVLSEWRSRVNVDCLGAGERKVRILLGDWRVRCGQTRFFRKRKTILPGVFFFLKGRKRVQVRVLCVAAGL